MLTQILIFSTAVEGIRNTTDLNFIIMCGIPKGAADAQKSRVYWRVLPGALVLGPAGESTGLSEAAPSRPATALEDA